MRLVTAAGCFLLALVIAAPAGAREWREVTLETQPVSFSARAADVGATYGGLTYEGGLILTSGADFFGGFSGLALNHNGTLATVVSDEGWLLRLGLETSQHSLVGINAAAMAPLTGMDAQPLGDKANKDAEALSIDADGRVAVVGFERTPRIWRYEVAADGLLVNPQGLPVPSPVRRVSFNQGIEALAILKAGAHAGKTLLFLEEPLPRIGSPQGWLMDGNDRQGFAVPLTAPYAITDAAEDSKGRIYVLERHYSPFSGPKMRIRRFNLDHLLAGYGVGEVLIEAGIEKMVDNFEALGIHETSFRVYLTLMSDDNFNALQRTLLLRFSLPK